MLQKWIDQSAPGCSGSGQCAAQGWEHIIPAIRDSNLHDSFIDDTVNDSVQGI